MKKIVLTLLIFLSTFSCKEDKEHLQKIITEEAMLYFYCDAGFATSQCNFVIETNNNEVFIPEKILILQNLGEIIFVKIL
jgi:hypothetical protein